MIDENSDTLLAGGDALMYLAVPMHKNIPQHWLGAIHLVRTCLRTNFSTLFSLENKVEKLVLRHVRTHLK